MRGREVVEYLKAGEKYDRSSGETYPDWTKPVVALTARALVEPVHEGEVDQTYRQANVVGYRLYHSGDPQISRTWKARVRGELLHITGLPAVWASPWSKPNTVVETRLQTG